MEDTVMQYHSMLMHNANRHLFPSSNNKKVHKDAKLCCCACRADFSTCICSQEAWKISRATKQAKNLRPKYLIMYRPSSPKEQAMDLCPYGTTHPTLW